MDAPLLQPSRSPLARAGKAFLNISLALAMIILASLIGMGGAALFIYKQMGNNVSVAKTSPNGKKTDAALADTSARPQLTPLSSDDAGTRHDAAASVADSTEWHFAEFSDKPRYIDVTYDGGRQHARLKVNTVLSSKPDVASSSFVSDVSDDEEDRAVPNDPGSRYIRDKQTGRIIGIDGSAGAAREVRRAQPVGTLPNNTIRNPVPEVRVASPVLQYGRPVFDSDEPVQAALPVSRSTYLPTRKAQPVYRDAYGNPVSSSFDTSRELTDDDDLPVRRAVPVRQGANTLPSESRFPTSDRTYVFGRN